MTETKTWDKFVIIKNYSSHEAISTLLTGYEGENLIGYTYIDHEKGITLEILKLFTDNNDELIITKDLIKDKSRALLRFEQFSETNFQIIDQKAASVFGATIPDYLKVYFRQNLETFRTDKDYDKFRTAGSPDDIQILLINNRNTPELIWARVESYDIKEKLGISKLIVQPSQDFNLSINDELIFKLMELNNQFYPVGIIDNKPDNKWWKFW